MYKLIFEFLTEPLGLPIQWYWEYIIMGIIGIVAFKIAWELSPGGTFGSIIHWMVRIFIFFILWLSVYYIIFAVKWLVANWLLALITLFVFVAMTTFIILIIHKRKTANKSIIPK